MENKEVVIADDFSIELLKNNRLKNINSPFTSFLSKQTTIEAFSYNATIKYRIYKFITNFL